MSVLETEIIKDEIAFCGNIDEYLEKIYPMISTQQDEWKQKITELLAESGLPKTQFAQLCGVSRQAMNNWCNGSIPRNRETFIKIGLAANCDLAQMNQLLQRYGRYPALYSKSLEDCVCIYVLSHAPEKGAAMLYQSILQRMQQVWTAGAQAERQAVSTEWFDEQLGKVQDEDELEQFISTNIASFSDAYRKLYAYIKMCIETNAVWEHSKSVHHMALSYEWSPSLEQTVSAINRGKWYPTRNKIISLGLHLCMDVEQIDALLTYARMEPLCAKNILESVIMFILEDAEVSDKLKYADDLLAYAKEVLQKLKLPEIDAFLLELPEDDDAW